MQQVPFLLRLKYCTVLGFALCHLLLRRHANRLALTPERPSVASEYSAPWLGMSDPAHVLMYMALLRNTQGIAQQRAACFRWMRDLFTRASPCQAASTAAATLQQQQVPSHDDLQPFTGLGPGLPR